MELPSDLEAFWRAGERDLADVIELFGLRIAQGDVVLDVNCGLGRLTPALAARAAHVVALDPSREAIQRAQELNGALNNVTWIVAEPDSLEGVEPGEADSALVLGRVRSAKDVLGQLTDLGRVLKPGGWAVLAVSTDPEAGRSDDQEDDAPERPPQAQTSRRDLLRGLAAAAAKQQRPSRPRRPPVFVPLDALGAVAIQAGLDLERIEGSNTAQTLVFARKPMPQPA